MSDKRIGILTFHNVPNYGAVLQTFATEKYLIKKGYKEVYVIDYRGCGNGDEFSIESILKKCNEVDNPVKRLIKKILFLLNKGKYKTKLLKFQSFRDDYLCLDSDLNHINQNYNIIFYGSDQIWNPQITDGYDPIYYAKNISNSKIILAGLAVSCGDVGTVKNNNIFLDNIKKFDYIGVREKSLGQYISKHDIACTQVMDPSFLLSSTEYRELLHIENCSEKYLLIYELQRNPQLKKIAHIIAKKKGIKIVHICGYLNFNRIRKEGTFNAGPIDFIRFLSNAEYVVTNSFHGLSFSLIFNKDFNIVLPKNRTSRIIDLLEILQLTDRIVMDDFENIMNASINYSIVNEILNKNIKDSKEYIDSVLNVGNC